MITSNIYGFQKKFFYFKPKHKELSKINKSFFTLPNELLFDLLPGET